jgi:dipeptidyl-peptidase-3
MEWGFDGSNRSQIFADLKRPEGLHLGFPGKGHVSEYYPESKGITEKEIEYINEFLSKKNLLPENTRLRKLEDGNFQILVASGVDNPPKESTDTNGVKSFDLGGILDGKRVDVVYGDFREEMAKIAHEMKLAGQYAANETQKIMMDKYAESFATGSIAAFKDSQRAWVKDISKLHRMTTLFRFWLKLGLQNPW